MISVHALPAAGVSIVKIEVAPIKFVGAIKSSNLIRAHDFVRHGTKKLNFSLFYIMR